MSCSLSLESIILETRYLQATENLPAHSINENSCFCTKSNPLPTFALQHGPSFFLCHINCSFSGLLSWAWESRANWLDFFYGHYLRNTRRHYLIEGVFRGSKRCYIRLLGSHGKGYSYYK